MMVAPYNTVISYLNRAFARWVVFLVVTKRSASLTIKTTARNASVWKVILENLAVSVL